MNCEGSSSLKGEIKSSNGWLQISVLTRQCFRIYKFRHMTDKSKHPAPRQILHVDMDAFFASVEQLDDPALAGKPVIVGGDPKGRGVVSAASYKAREFGARSAMPMARAIKLCPQAIVLPVRMDRYAEVSREMNAIFKRYTPLVERLSIDEAFLDVTASGNLFGSGEKIGHAIKKAIKEELDLVASVGVAPNKFLAKLASDLEKPDGFVVITEQNKQQILDPLPVSKIWGVGKVTAKALQAHGIGTIIQLRTMPLATLKTIVGNCASSLHELACGIDERAVEPAGKVKSVSAERTFPRDIEEKDFLLGVLLDQVQEVARQLRADNLKARTITIKLRYADFRTITRSHTLKVATNTTQDFWQVAQAIFEKWYSGQAVRLRLIGFSASCLAASDTGQPLLFPDMEEEKQQRLDKTLDQIGNRFGKDKIRRGSKN